MDAVVAQDFPDTLAHFIRDSCHLPLAALRPLPASEVPEPALRLLVHPHDMTSTLSAFHGSPLQTDVLQTRRDGELYLREVFLRTERRNAIVEYGVIAIALNRFSASQQREILAGRTPLGALLHRFQIEFVSSPIGFFSVSGEQLEATPLAVKPDATCYGRFNRLSTPQGQPLAWIVEILPP